MWKTKSDALKWGQKVNKWPCRTCSQAPYIGNGCSRGGSIAKVKLSGGRGYAWSAQVWCLCETSLPTVQVGAFVMVPVRPARKPGRGRAAHKG